MGVIKVPKFKQQNVPFHISPPLQLCLSLAPFPRYYHLFPDR